MPRWSLAFIHLKPESAVQNGAVAPVGPLSVPVAQSAPFFALHRSLPIPFRKPQSGTAIRTPAPATLAVVLIVVAATLTPVLATVAVVPATDAATQP